MHIWASKWVEIIIMKRRVSASAKPTPFIPTY